MPRTRTRYPSLLAGAVAIALLVTGCHVKNPYEPTEPGAAAEAAQTLTTLPSLEDTREQVETAILHLGHQISTIAPEVFFEWRREDSRGRCLPPFEQTEGEDILLRAYVSETPIPERHWQQAYELAVETAHSLGADHLTVFKDAPNDHDLRFTSDTGTTFRFGSQAAALISGSTGCRLPKK